MNKLIAVSGGTKGIGRAIIERFAAAGFDVITCSRNEQDLQQLKENIEGKSTRLFYVVADMSTRSGVKTFSEAILKLNRPVDVLVNNSGYFEPGQITEEPEGVLEKMMESNVYSAYHLTRSIVPEMKKVKKGHIFSICSVASLIAYPNGGSYSITKFAMLGFSKVLREELKEFGTRVTAVIAGATRTASWDGVDLPDERFMRPEDIAEAIFGAYTLSDRTVVEELILRPQLGDI